MIESLKYNFILYSPVYGWVLDDWIQMLMLRFGDLDLDAYIPPLIQRPSGNDR